MNRILREDLKAKTEVQHINQYMFAYAIIESTAKIILN